MNNFYIYFHINILTNKIFYVGKGKNQRAYNKKDRSLRWKNYVKSNGYFIDIVETGLTELEAFEKEIQYINFLGLKNLINITKGGTGGDTISNHPNRSEIIKVISNKTKGSNNPNFRGKSITDEWRIKQKESQSKKHLKITDTITGLEYFFKNSKDAASFFNGKPSNLRTCKGNYLFLKRYKVEDYILNEF